MPRPFLTARWEHLCILTYAVPSALIAEILPRGLEPDTRDGSAFVSLVAFDFVETRVRGVKIPMHVDFPEVNLRCYVREKAHAEERRGVCFVREFVPRIAISWVARLLYNEPYATASMCSRVRRQNGIVTARHEIRTRGETSTIEIEADDRPFTPPEDSWEHFFKEHRWGYGAGRDGRLLRYEVVHPVWEVFPVRNFSLAMNWARVYGPRWALLQSARPVSVVLARGSEVSVSPVLS